MAFIRSPRVSVVASSPPAIGLLEYLCRTWVKALILATSAKNTDYSMVGFAGHFVYTCTIPLTY